MANKVTEFSVKQFVDSAWSIFRSGDIIALDVNGDRVGYVRFDDDTGRRGYAIGTNDDVLLPYFYCDWEGKKHNLIGEEQVGITLSNLAY